MGHQVVLTELRNTDSETLLRWINDPVTVRFNAAYAPIHEPCHEAWLSSIANDQTRVVFAIRLKSNDRLIGVVQLTDIHPIFRSAQLSIRLGLVTDRGKGAGSEAARLAIRHAFEDRNLTRVWLIVFADNPHAIRAYEKAGMTIEGKLRQAYFIGGRWLDGIMMSILSEERNS